MINILYGESGTGKTEYIIDKIREDVCAKRRVYWLVPEQKAIICERKLAALLPPSAQLYAEVLNFTRLCDKAFRLYGGLKYNYISKSGKNLIMYRALCEVRGMLTEYKLTKGRERGCVSLFLDAIGELKSYDVSPKALLDASEKLKNERLKGRIRDLVCVFEAYNRILNESYSDPYDDIIMLRDKLCEHKLFEGASVYISSFYGFTGAQFSVLRQILAQADNVTLSLDLSKDSIGKIQYAKLSTTAEQILQSCRRLGKEVTEISFETDVRHKTEALSYLSKSIWRFDSAPFKNHDGITLIRPSDEFDECDTVSAMIKELIMQGAKYSETAVIMRKTDTYRGIIDLSFEKYEIPYYMSASTDVLSKPLVKMLCSAINASGSWSIRDIASFIRSGYADITSEEADLLESYVYRWGIYGHRFRNVDYWSANPDGYVTAPTEAQANALAKINGVRARIIQMLSDLSDAFERGADAKKICVAVYGLLESMKIREKLSAEIAQAEKDDAMELSQLYSAIIEALNTIAEIMPDEELDREGFLSALSYVLDGVKVGTIPTGEDNVTVGEADSLRAEKIKYAFVLGVTEGSFPASINTSPFFSDSDKEELELEGIILSETTDVRADNELLNFKNSISVASHKVVISAPRADIRGSLKEPSVAFERITYLFPSLKDSYVNPIPIKDKIYTERIAREHATGISESAVAIRELLDIKKESFELSNENLAIPSERAAELFGKSLYLSQSKIEKFASCHLQYYCSYLLSLKESDVISFGAREVGTLSHAVLESFLKRAREGSVDFEKMSDAEIEGEVDKITEDYIALLCPNGQPSSKLRHLFNRLRANIVIYIRELASEFAQSGFIPEFFELKFSNDPDGVAPLKFDAGNGATVTLSGVVDRVDIYRSEDTAYIRVVDYKTGEKKFTYSAFDNGLELQLLIYLFTLCKVKDGPFKQSLLGGAKKLAPAGVMYFPMQLGKSTVDGEFDLNTDTASEAERKAVAELVKRNGVFLDDENVLIAQDKEKSGHYVPKKYAKNAEYFLDVDGFDGLYSRLEGVLYKIGSEMLSGNAKAEPLKLKGITEACEYCEHKAMCRRRSK